MFIDQLKLHVQAGKGGDGLVHFAAVKYQPFGGPDGGDGGAGGSVAFTCTRAVEDLGHLRGTALRAGDGEPGGPNLRIGASAKDLEVPVPPGTIVYDALTGEELGALTGSGQRLVAAQGGKGGLGNPAFASARNRTPRKAGKGKSGEERDVELRYRIFADTALVECPFADLSLLPGLLNKPAEATDSALYARKPRWVRVEHNYRQFDLAYFTCEIGEELHIPWAAHLYWPRVVVVNLLPLGELLQPACGSLTASFSQAVLHRLERVLLLASAPVNCGPVKAEPGAVRVDCAVCHSSKEAKQAMLDAMVGTVVA